jgi:site-specific recombinase XerD
MSNLVKDLIAKFIIALKITPQIIRKQNSGTRGRGIGKKYSDDTIKSHRNILLKKGGAFPVFPFLELVASASNPIFTFRHAELLQKGVDTTDLAVPSKNNIKKTCRAFFRFTDHEGYIKEEPGAIDSIFQTEVPDEPKTIYSPKQRDILDNSKWSKNPMVDLRNQGISQLLRRHGDRSGLEIHKCNRDEIDTILWIITIHGKGGKTRFHRLFHDEIPLWEQYLKARDNHVKNNPGYADENALIIRLHPEMTGRGNIATWRLDRPGIWAVYDRMREKNPILKGTKPYTGRYTRITHVHIICQILGIPLEAASKAFGNSLIVRMRDYDNAYDLQEELLCADFDTKLGPLLLEIEKYCDYQISSFCSKLPISNDVRQLRFSCF